jgi:hypothetical protein
MFLEAQARTLGAHVAFDTHHNARNWEFSCWRGNTLHRVDFQPLENGAVSITRYRDHFRALSRLLRWAHNVVPMFPYLARIERTHVASLPFPLSENDVVSALPRVDA